MWYKWGIQENPMATKSETIRARVAPKLKHKAEAMFDALGLTPTEAITLFYTQVALRRGLPFEIKIPNRATRAAMRDAERGKNLKRWKTLAALKAAHR
jgi:DNA-damage-inducible protein J